MSDLRSYIDRILRLKEEADALGADVRDVYTEAKSHGFDKTALGQTVTILRKKAKDGEKFEEQSERVQEYLSEYERPLAHTRARARANTEAPTSRPGTVEATAPVAQEGFSSRPATAKTSDQEAGEASASGEAQDRSCESASPPNSEIAAGHDPAPFPVAAHGGDESAAPTQDAGPIPTFLDRRSAA